MTSEFLHNLKLAIAVTMVCVWAAITLSNVAILEGMSYSLLFIASLVQYPDSPWSQRLLWHPRESTLAVLAVIALIAACWLLSKLVPDESTKAFFHSPLFVLSASALCILALVRQATVVLREATGNPSDATVVTGSTDKPSSGAMRQLRR